MAGKTKPVCSVPRALENPFQCSSHHELHPRQAEHLAVPQPSLLMPAPSVAVMRRKRNKTYSFLSTTSSTGCWVSESTVGTRNTGASAGAEKSSFVYSSEINTGERRKKQELVPRVPRWVAQVGVLPLLMFVLSSICSPFCPCQLLLQLPSPFPLPPAMPTLLVVLAAGAVVAAAGAPGALAPFASLVPSSNAASSVSLLALLQC